MAEFIGKYKLEGRFESFPLRGTAFNNINGLTPSDTSISRQIEFKLEGLALVGAGRRFRKPEAAFSGVGVRISSPPPALFQNHKGIENE